MIHRVLILFAILFGLSSAAAERPNIVFIFSDDVNRDSWALYGNPDCKTPNIDKLAAEGMRFDNFYCSVAMCGPFRQELYSGRSPWRTGTLANHSKSTPDTKSIPHYLKPLGYKVGLVGKTHIGPIEAYPFEDIKGGELIKGAADFIDASVAEGKKFCLFMASKDGHAPHTTGDASQYPPDKLTVPPYWLDTPETRSSMSKYYAEVTHFDDMVGEARAMLEKKGLLENTLLMVCSEQGVQFPFAKWTCYDNGLHIGMVARYPKGIKAGSAAPQLLSLMDVTPTLVELAGGKLEAGQVDGKSFVSVLEGKPKEINSHVYGAFTNCKILDNKRRVFPIRSVRDKRYTLLYCPNHEEITSNVTLTGALLALDGKPDPSKGKGHANTGLTVSWVKRREQDERAAFLVERLFNHPEYALYDRSVDPHEENNLIDNPKHADTVKHFKQALHAWLEKVGDADPLATENKMAGKGKGKRK